MPRTLDIPLSFYICVPAILTYIFGGLAYYVSSVMMNVASEYYGAPEYTFFPISIALIFGVMGTAKWYMDITIAKQQLSEYL